MKNRRYFLGRIIKINTSQDELMDAITSSPTLPIRNFDWTITDIVDSRKSEFPFIFGKLSKFAENGKAKVIDEKNKSQINTDIPNLLEASSPFVYLPEYSGIAFLHVWNEIQEDVFRKRFTSLIKESLSEKLLTSCHIESLSDYIAFTTRLEKLSEITEISATVHPPNPLYGRVWEDLNNYLKTRDASEVSISEKSSASGGIKSQIKKLMKVFKKGEIETYTEPTPMADAAVLMAADGYGKAKIAGIENGEAVEFTTSDTNKSFKFKKDPNPIFLALAAKKQFEKVSTERSMKH